MKWEWCWEEGHRYARCRSRRTIVATVQARVEEASLLVEEEVEEEEKVVPITEGPVWGAMLEGPVWGVKRAVGCRAWPAGGGPSRWRGK